MFDGCRNLEKIEYGEDFSFTNIKNVSSMFSDCKSLKSFIFPHNFSEGDSSKYGNFGSNVFVFDGCEKLKGLKNNFFRRIFCCENKIKRSFTAKEFWNVIEVNVLYKNTDIPFQINLSNSNNNNIISN
jgi:hypothetical protein